MLSCRAGSKLPDTNTKPSVTRSSKPITRSQSPPRARKVSRSKSDASKYSQKFFGPRKKPINEPLNRRTSIESCQTSDDLELKKVSLETYARRMAWDEDYTCPHHDGSIVVLFCHTCEELICAKCVSHGASGTGGAHKDHLYLDVQEAYDLKREEFEKLLAAFKDQLINKKGQRHDLQTTIQRLKLELLRRKTLVDRKTRSLKDALLKKERALSRQLDAIMAPTLSLHDNRYQELDFDVVMEDGLVGSGESLLKLPADRGVSFLKSAMKTKKNIEQAMGKNYSQNDGVTAVLTRRNNGKSSLGPHPELAQLSHLTSSFHRERTTFRHAFSFEPKAPATPRLLRGWCTIGFTSASLVWKYSKLAKVSTFLLYYHPISVNNAKGRPPVTEGPQEKHLKSLGYTCIRLRKFTGGRTNAVLRTLSEGTSYHVVLYAANEAGLSQPLSFYFTTLCHGAVDNECLLPGTLSFEKPVIKTSSDFCRRTKNFFRTMYCVMLSLYFFISLILIVFHNDHVIFRAFSDKSWMTYVQSFISNFRSEGGAYDEGIEDFEYDFETL